MSKSPSNDLSKTGGGKTGSPTKTDRVPSLNKTIKTRDTQDLDADNNTPNVRAVDLLDSLKLATNTGIKEKIEIARLQLESETLEIEKIKTVAGQKFWVRNFGATITAVISLAAILVSVSQIWIATIQKEKEIEVTKNQKAKELEILRVQQERAWKMDMAKFVSEHGNKLLGTDKAQRKLMTDIMVITFPKEYSRQLIDRFEAVTDSPEVRRELQNIRTNVLPKIQTTENQERVKIYNNTLQEEGGYIFPTESENPILFHVHPPGPIASPVSSPIVSPSLTSIPHDSCSCPSPFQGGINCWGQDDAAFCPIINDRCVPRCETARR